MVCVNLDKDVNFSFQDIIAGTVTIIDGNTSAVITHNLNTTNYVVKFEPNADVVSHWFSDKNLNDVTVNMSAPQFGKNVDFDYEIIKL